MFPIIYTLILSFVYLLSIPFLIFLSFKKKYRHSIPARFFLYKNPPFKKSGVWFHACSLGEVKSIRPLLERVKGIKNISVITQTGFDEAKSYGFDTRFLPFEILLFFWMKPQKVLVVAEAELWYLLFYLAKKRGTKTILVNGRISERSYPKYLKFRWFYRKIFENIDKVFCQRDIDRKRLEILGAKNVEVVGNIKSAQEFKPTRKLKRTEEILITAASTHEGEEELVLKAFKEYGRGKLVIVPRHPERFDRVWRLVKEFAKKEGFSCVRFSEDESFKADITVVDKMGELINIYAISNIVILGGSFVPIGGHNPLEPANFGCSLITGPNIFNQHETFSKVENYHICESENLADILKKELGKSYIKEKNDLSPIIREIECGMR
ncbi:lipid IV(A) 3-deoxy-D-manno-octulosonic acid transferase [Nitrosophilus alvini]|uniref:lipid IV(A) 3-deoxy-D-manno-octulosonic acid transferase n=1 Tax=Nitrosophilus alvini TaxID=2714855 RepID=UPI001909CF20|nr:lipid IV(A) 3-deoxy-D-manno-octulosonic acid transferase [Nitrosophilus alvini]